MTAPIDLSLYLVTDTKPVRGRNWLTVVDEAVRGGVSVVQLRDKELAGEALVAKARALQDLLRPRNVPLIVNDSVDVAEAVSATGVHLGASDMDPRAARARLGANATIGLSLEKGREVADEVLDAVDYVAASPLFPSATKTDAGPPWELAGLRRLRTRYSLPLVAIGGIDETNLESVLREGVDGVALVRAVRDAQDVFATTARLRNVVTTRLRERTSRVLTIAGSDSGGGAGIQADLKTFQALGAFGMSAVTAVTAQNTVSVDKVFALPPSMVTAQIEAVARDIGIDAVKIGMLSSRDLVEAVADCVERLALPRVVLDPVMVAKGGHALLEEDAVRHLVERLFPLADIITPNLPEAQAILRRTIGSEEEMEAALGGLLRLAKRVVLKGGHLNDATSSDLFGDDVGRRLWVRAPRVRTRNTHGTGCTFSSAIAAYAARGLPWDEAVQRAKEYLSGAVAQGARALVGHGHGPVAHRWNLQETL